MIPGSLGLSRCINTDASRSAYPRQHPAAACASHRHSSQQRVRPSKVCPFRMQRSEASVSHRPFFAPLTLHARLNSGTHACDAPLCVGDLHTTERCSSGASPPLYLHLAVRVCPSLSPPLTGKSFLATASYLITQQRVCATTCLRSFLFPLLLCFVALAPHLVSSLLLGDCPATLL